MYSSARKLPSVKLLKERFEVDPSSPTGLRYRSNVGKMKAGDVVGSIATSGTGAPFYRTIVNYTNYQIHRIIWKMVHGKDPENVIDHIDNNPLNNNISNLRDVTQGENMLNRKDYK